MRVAVLCKAPIPGSVKTRLAPALGAEGAAALHRALARRTVATALSARIGRVELWCAPDPRHPFFAELAARTGIVLRTQPPGDLGSRMAGALGAGADLPAVLVGTDCPGLDAAALQSAAGALEAGLDAVFIPALDGGYTLVGLGRALPVIFSGVAWGTAGVMAATRRRLEAAGARWRELTPLADVDRPEDLGWLREAFPELAPVAAGGQGSS